MDATALAAWLAAEMEKRNLSANQLGKDAGVSGSQVANVLAGRSKPGVDFLEKIPDALGISRYEFLQVAGILPPRVDDPLLRDIWRVANELSPDARRWALAALRGMRESDTS